MNKIFSALLACVVAFSVFAGFAPEASAQNKHVYLYLESIGCPYLYPGGYSQYTLRWKSEDEIPSIPEANEYKQFFPEKEDEGNCYGTTNVLNVNQKYQFPVDRNILLQPDISGDGSFPETSVVIPATQNLEGTEITTSGVENPSEITIIKYKVTFE